jgi:hypothetical protein
MQVLWHHALSNRPLAQQGEPSTWLCQLRSQCCSCGSCMHVYVPVPCCGPYRSPAGEWGVKKCHIVRYSHGGALWAAVGRTNTIVVRHREGCGSYIQPPCSLIIVVQCRVSLEGCVVLEPYILRTPVLQVHSSFSGRQMCALKGHVSAVTDLTFSPDDRILCSTGGCGREMGPDGLVPAPRLVPCLFECQMMVTSSIFSACISLH